MQMLSWLDADSCAAVPLTKYWFVGPNHSVAAIANHVFTSIQINFNDFSVGFELFPGWLFVNHSAVGGIRTLTLPVLSRFPLPLGYYRSTSDHLTVI